MTWADEPTVVISGASGLIGTALGESLASDGWRVVRLVRRPARDRSEVSWDPGIQALDPAVLEGAAALVNLSGASIAKVPWTRAYRAELVRSRLRATRTLARAIGALGEDAPHFLSASAVGYYGDRPGEKLTEDAGPGETFLAELCAAWEGAAVRGTDAARVALLRTAPVLHPEATLKPLLPLTRFGLAGPLGSGKQHWPWISLEDEVRGIRHVIDHGLVGPVNLAGPEPATANQLGRALARQLRRPFLMPAPKVALRAALTRDAADGLLLPDAAVIPRVLQARGFEFSHPTLQSALAAGLAAR